jgi:hypothetical protein
MSTTIRTDKGSPLTHIELDTNFLFTDSRPTPLKIGGIEAGTDFLEEPVKEVLRRLLYPFIDATANLSNLGIREKGKAFDINVNGAVNSNDDSFVLAGGLRQVFLKTGSTVLVNPQTNTFVYTDLGVEADKTYTLEANFDQAGLLVINKTVRFYAPSYYGVGAPNLVEADIKNLNKNIWAPGDRNNLVFNPNLERYYFVYPAAFGNLSAIIDQNNFDVTAGFTKRTSTFTLFDGVQTELMNIYESNADTTQVNFELDFKF